MHTAADFTPVIEFYNRNALTWDDARKVSAFVTAKDPEIMRFAKKAIGCKDSRNSKIEGLDLP